MVYFVILYLRYYYTKPVLVRHTLLVPHLLLDTTQGPNLIFKAPTCLGFCYIETASPFTALKLSSTQPKC